MLASATDPLRGLLAYVLLSRSFRHLGAWAVVNEVADISAVAWQKRLIQSRPWARAASACRHVCPGSRAF